MRLTANFFSRPARVVAAALLGQQLVHQIGNQQLAGIIVETSQQREANTKNGRYVWPSRHYLHGVHLRHPLSL